MNKHRLQPIHVKDARMTNLTPSLLTRAILTFHWLSFSLVLFQPRDIRIVCHGGEMLQQGILSLAIGSHLPFVTVILDNGVDLLSS